MKNKESLNLVQSLIVNHSNFTSRRYSKLREHTYNSIYGSWESRNWHDLRNLFFALVTGEPNFENFYNRFDAPASKRGNPIAWGPRFLPDMICDDIWDNGLQLEEKVKRIKNLYDKCMKLEKSFKKLSKGTK